MGIKDLLPHLKSIQKSRHVSDYAGLVVAVDGYCWYYTAYLLTLSYDIGCIKVLTVVQWN